MQQNDRNFQKSLASYRGKISDRTSCVHFFPFFVSFFVSLVDIIYGLDFFLKEGKDVCGSVYLWCIFLAAASYNSPIFFPSSFQ
jgi:hypothetical protein